MSDKENHHSKEVEDQENDDTDNHTNERRRKRERKTKRDKRSHHKHRSKKKIEPEELEEVEKQLAEIEDSGKTVVKPKAKTKVFALLTRFLFLCHVIISGWRAITVSNNTKLWIVVVIVIALMLAETALILVRRKGHELKRFCSAIFLLLIGVVPFVVIIEVNRLGALRAGVVPSSTSTLTGISGPLNISFIGWAILIEQMLMAFIIIGRWLLPKGHMSRNQLSQLLLIQLGVAADIIELFEIFSETTVVQDAFFCYVILATYSWSLLQFTFVIPPPHIDDLIKDDDPKPCIGQYRFCQAEVASLISTMCLQDGPFFAVRLTAIIKYHVVSYANFFFTVKNAFVIFLLCYRLIIITVPKCDRPDDDLPIDEKSSKKSKEKTKLNATP